MSITQQRKGQAGHSVGVCHAKTHLSQLLEWVATGEEITINKHDRPVARLVPADRNARADVAAVFRRMDELRNRLPKAVDAMPLKDLIHEGKRF